MSFPTASDVDEVLQHAVQSVAGLDVINDVDCGADDVWFDAAFVDASSDAEVAAITPPVAPRVGAQLYSCIGRREYST